MKKLLSCAVLFCAVALVGCSKANNAEGNAEGACNDSTCTEQHADCNKPCENVAVEGDTTTTEPSALDTAVEGVKGAAKDAVNNAVEGVKDAATEAVNNAVNSAVDAGNKAVEDIKNGIVEKVEEGAAALKK